MSNTMKMMVHHQATSDDEMRNQAQKRVWGTMLNDGMQKVNGDYHADRGGYGLHIHPVLINSRLFLPMLIRPVC